MAVYTLSDLHLAKSIDKPMDIFGMGWAGYMDKIYENWQSTVNDGDTVIIGGDLSWAMYLDECKPDFDFIEGLNGNKVILKGNHDYWWESITKLNNYVESNGYKTMRFLHNNSYVAENVGIFGTRGWITPLFDNFKEADRKIYERELIRLELSYNHLNTIKTDGVTPVAVLHYPPVNKEGEVDAGFKAFFDKYNIKHCIYGHLHGLAGQSAFGGEICGVNFKIASADVLEFKPFKLDL